MKTTLITGINGFLGSSIAKKLCERYNIIGIEYTNNLYRIKDYNFKVYFHNENENSLDLIFKENKIDIIIHAATIYGRNKENISDLIRTNILLPIDLYQLAGKNGVSLFMNTDSFMNQPNMISYLEEYVVSKKQSLEWLRMLSNVVSCKLVNMIIFHQYGPNDSPDKFVPNIINKLIKNQKSIELTMGEQMRDFIYIEDVISSYDYVIESLDQLDNFSEFQVGSGTSMTIREFVELAKEISNSHTLLNFGALPYRDHEIMDLKADNKSLLMLGWQPQFKIEQGLMKMIGKEACC